MGRKMTPKQNIMDAAKEFFEVNQRSPFYHEVGFSKTAINNYWNTYNDFLVECNLPLNKNYHDLKTREDGIEFLKQLSVKLNRIPNRDDLRNEKINMNWFSTVFDSYKDALFHSELIEKVDKRGKTERVEDSIAGLIELYKTLKRCPKVDEYDEHARKTELIQRRNLEINLGLKYNEICLKYLGVANQIEKSKEEILNELVQLKNKLGRTPMAKELIQYGLPKFTKYQKVFGVKYNDLVFSLGWEISGHISISKTNEELKEDYNTLFNKLGRIPLDHDIRNESHMCSPQTYKLKFGSLKQLWDELNIDVSKYISNIDMGYGYTYIDKDNDLCRSFPEMLITNYLIDNGIKYIKEYPYKDLIINLKSKKRFDWYLPEYDVSVEYFGLYDEKRKGIVQSKYTKKANEKIKICKENNIILIDLYKDDLNNEMYGLITKMNSIKELSSTSSL